MLDTTLHDNKRVIEGKNGGKLTPFNPETARAAVKAREEKRMRLYAEGAQLATIDPELLRKYKEDAHIVERARTMQEIATTPDAGKAAVMAAQHLDKAQGLTVDKTQETQSAMPDVIQSAVLGLISAVMDKVGRDTIDGQVMEAEAGGGGDTVG